MMQMSSEGVGLLFIRTFRRNRRGHQDHPGQGLDANWCDQESPVSRDRVGEENAEDKGRILTAVYATGLKGYSHPLSIGHLLVDGLFLSF